MTYQFTQEQLSDLLFGTVEMFIEYRDTHGHEEESAKFAAVKEMFEGLEAEKELVQEGVMSRATSQIVEKEDQQ